jgi:cell division transport system ATP-binding protein
MIVARDLTKKFGSLFAVNSVTFSVAPGEFVFLTGPSGSGKTSLIRLFIRDLKPDSGQLQVDGQDLFKLPASKLPLFRRGIGTVFQDFKLLSDLSVGENVAVPLEVRGVSPVDVKTAVKLALEMVGLSDKANVFPAQLSGGELQRVGLARAIVGKPKLLLADEPTGNLDPKTAKSIVKLIKEIHTHLKTTVVMATHNSEIVNHYNLRVISLNSGKLVKDSPEGKYDD